MSLTHVRALCWFLPDGLQLMPETLYLTINLIDRFLEVSNVSRKRLQLVGGCGIVGVVS